MDLYKLGVKIFVANPGAVNIRDFISVYQSWIQKQNIEGHLLIDVHDYSHVPDGPGILLVAHEGNFSMDQEGGRLGLFYYRKRPLDGNAQANLRSIVKTALQACKLLEAEPKLKGLKFQTSELLIVANDRLLAPNTQEALAGLQPAVTAALGDVFKGAPIKLSPSRKMRGIGSV